MGWGRMKLGSIDYWNIATLMRSTGEGAVATVEGMVDITNLQTTKHEGERLKVSGDSYKFINVKKDSTDNGVEMLGY